MPSRVVVFFDWQNVYKRAREAFESSGVQAPAALKGQTDPVDLAHVLVRKHFEHSGVAAELEQIRIYRGRPTQQNDPKGYNAFQRQAAKWAMNNKVRAHYNDLRYPDDWGTPNCDPPREKGIDVALAVDLVTMAHDRAMDVAIVMSADYDLVPALSHVVDRSHDATPGPIVEVAAWKGDLGDKPLRIRLQNRSLWCHWLDRQDYWGVQDETDYNVKPEPRPADGRPRPEPPRRNF